MKNDIAREKLKGDVISHENQKQAGVEKSPADPSFWQGQTGVCSKYDKDGLDKIAKLVEDKKVSQETLKEYLPFLNAWRSSEEKESLLRVLDILLEGDKNGDDRTAFFEALTSSGFLGQNIMPSQIEAAFDMTPFQQDLIENYFSKFKTNDEPVFSNGRELLYLVSILNEENFEDFENCAQEAKKSEGIPQKEAFFNLAIYRNPKTLLFDKDIYDLSKKLISSNENANFDEYYFVSLAQACVDEKTGKISKQALDFLSKNYFKIEGSSKLSKAKNNIKNLNPLIKARNQAINYYQSRNGTEVSNAKLLLESLKDNSGAFNKTNLKLVSKLVYDYPIKICADVELVDLMKNENGVIDKDLFDITSNAFERGIDVAKIKEILEIYSERGKESANVPFEALDKIYKYERHIFNNFPSVAKNCFDEDGIHFDEENLNFVIDLAEANQEIELCDEIFEAIQNKDNKALILKFARECPLTTDGLAGFAEVVEKYGDEAGNIDSFVRQKMEDAMQIGVNPHVFCRIFESCTDANGENFDNQGFDTLIEVVSKSTSLPYVLANKEAFGAFLSGNFGSSSLDFKTKLYLTEELQKIKEKNPNLSTGASAFIEKSLVKLDVSLSADNIFLPVEKEAATEFIRSVIGNDPKEENGLTHFENVLKGNILTLENMPKGLKVSYPREKFLSDLSKICNSKDKLDLLSSKTSIDLITNNNGEITGYNGIILLNELDKDDEFEGKIYKLCHEFLYENEACTGNLSLDDELNKIIKACPEFMNTVGKKQHGTHKYSLDIHQLLMLANSIDNPNYLTLNDTDKAMLKAAAIFHDITKPEADVDKGHQNSSSVYARSIVEKFFKNPEARDRVYELIKNHHWLEEYSSNPSSEAAREFAFKFRRPNDFEVSKIMAKADLKAVDGSFYESHKEALEPQKLENIKNELQYLYSTGSAIFSDYPSAENIPDELTENFDGIDYKVINFNNINDDQDLSKYGFRKGLTKGDLKFLVHMVPENEMSTGLYKVNKLTSAANGGVLSESLITPKYKRTYCNRKYGVLLSQINPSVINARSENQGSGREKDINTAIDLIWAKGATMDYARRGFRDVLMNSLALDKNSITDEDYANFYRENIASKTSLNQFSDTKEYKIGSHSFMGAEIKQAIKDYQESLIDKKEENHNEIVGYVPKIKAAIAKAENLSEVPLELLKFADENKLPVILI